MPRDYPAEARVRLMKTPWTIEDDDDILGRFGPQIHKSAKALALLAKIARCGADLGEVQSMIRDAAKKRQSDDEYQRRMRKGPEPELTDVKSVIDSLDREAGEASKEREASERCPGDVEIRRAEEAALADEYELADLTVDEPPAPFSSPAGPFEGITIPLSPFGTSSSSPKPPPLLLPLPPPPQPQPPPPPPLPLPPALSRADELDAAALAQLTAALSALTSPLGDYAEASGRTMARIVSANTTCRLASEELESARRAASQKRTELRALRGAGHAKPSAVGACERELERRAGAVERAEARAAEAESGLAGPEKRLGRLLRAEKALEKIRELEEIRGVLREGLEELGAESWGQ